MNPRVIQWRVRASTEALQRTADDDTASRHPRNDETTEENDRG